MRISSVNPLPEYKLDLHFADGKHGIYDMRPTFCAPVFKQLENEDFFKTVHLDSECGYVAWGSGEVDIATERLYRDSLSV